MPLTVHSDLLRLAKLARAGQVNLPAAIAQCCAAGAGGSSAPFAPLTSGLEETLSRAVVNASAIAAALAGEAAAARPSPGGGLRLEAGSAGAELEGRLVNVGGVQGCPGSVEALETGARSEVTTDALGAFAVQAPALAHYRFAPAAAAAGAQGGDCRDAVTGVSLRFPWSAYLPPAPSAVLTPLALLTVPAAGDASVAAAYNASASGGGAPPFLWSRVHGLFGYDDRELGVGRPGGGEGRG